MARAYCRVVIIVSLVATASAAVSAYPHQMAYFNPLHGGPWGGHERLLHSNVDWRQDWRQCREALFGPRKWVRHGYPVIYALEWDGGPSPEGFGDLAGLRAVVADGPPGTRFGVCLGRTLESQVMHRVPTFLRFGAEDVEECLRRADGRTAVTPTVVLLHCRVPGPDPDR